ncbi:alkaline shock response membrane anchor protein AmaP [Streptomyces antimycoticus]|uniref:alkaline shock response membrane anchor protein AmaP n=1 Tax=Streptomyces antimycoticus TaxID=68175 RepID=UPI000A3D2548|nr:alkaline shock response membrane anchor protein AmaP [Streptomyces antimycoticus]
MLSVVNRVLLGVVGLVLAGVGAVVLAGWPPFGGRGDVLLSRADRTRWRDAGWWWPTVIAALAVLFVLALCWFLAQLRRRRLQEVLVETGDGEGALLRGRALEAVLLADAESLDGVERAHVLLRGRRTTPEARMGLVLEPRAEPTLTLDALRAEALERARSSAGLEQLPAEVRLRVARHGAERAR